MNAEALDVSQVPLLILAGGKATRLKHLSQNTPKYLMPVGDRCFADIHLEWAAQQGFKDILLSLGHLSEQIQAHCGNGEKYGLTIKYLLDGDTPLGTGGALLK